MGGMADINHDRRRFLLGRFSPEEHDEHPEFDVRVLQCTVSALEPEKSFWIDYSIANLGIARATILVHRHVGERNQVIKMLHLDAGNTFHGTWKEAGAIPPDGLAIEVEARCKGDTVTTLHRPTLATPDSDPGPRSSTS